MKFIVENYKYAIPFEANSWESAEKIAAKKLYGKPHLAVLTRIISPTQYKSKYISTLALVKKAKK